MTQTRMKRATLEGPRVEASSAHGFFSLKLVEAARMFEGIDVKSRLTRYRVETEVRLLSNSEDFIVKAAMQFFDDLTAYYNTLED